MCLIQPKKKKGARKFFIKAEYIELVNAVFYYKINPEKLIAKFPHPEKIISIKSTVGQLQGLLERFLRSI